MPLYSCMYGNRRSCLSPGLGFENCSQLQGLSADDTWRVSVAVGRFPRSRTCFFQLSRGQNSVWWEIVGGCFWTYSTRQGAQLSHVPKEAQCSSHCYALPGFPCGMVSCHVLRMSLHCAFHWNWSKIMINVNHNWKLKNNGNSKTKTEKTRRSWLNFIEKTKTNEMKAVVQKAC